MTWPANGPVPDEHDAGHDGQHGDEPQDPHGGDPVHLRRRRLRQLQRVAELAQARRPRGRPRGRSGCTGGSARASAPERPAGGRGVVGVIESMIPRRVAYQRSTAPTSASMSFGVRAVTIASSTPSAAQRAHVLPRSLHPRAAAEGVLAALAAAEAERDPGVVDGPACGRERVAVARQQPLERVDLRRPAVADPRRDADARPASRRRSGAAAPARGRERRGPPRAGRSGSAASPGRRSTAPG